MPMPEFRQLVDEARNEIQEINLGELKKMQQGGEDFALIDVRDKQDAENGMIPQAVNISRACWNIILTRSPPTRIGKSCFIAVAAAGQRWRRHR